MLTEQPHIPGFDAGASGFRRLVLIAVIHSALRSTSQGGEVVGRVAGADQSRLGDREQSACVGGSYGNSFWYRTVVPLSPFQSVLYRWKCSTNSPVAVTLSPLTTTP